MNSSTIDFDQELIQQALEGDWTQAERIWPGLLSRILAAVQSPARTRELADSLKQESWYQETAGAWGDLDPGERKQTWEDLTQRLIRAAYRTRPHCIRCGQCCSSGSPALLAGEAEAVRPGGIFHHKAYTIRAGEPVVDNLAGGVALALHELIKPLDPGGVCFFYDQGKGCRVYDDRPAQCRALACWEEPGGATEFEGPFLDRAAALEGQGLKLDYAAAHQARCPSSRIVELARAALQDDKSALTGLEEMIAFDLHTRLFAKDKGHLEEDELDLVLGRPVAVILKPLGLEVWEIQGRIRLRQSP